MAEKASNFLGFTGTKQGMTPVQHEAVRQFIINHKPFLFNHGCCIGADAQAHAICLSLKIPIRGYPPVRTKYIMDIKPDEFYHLYPPKDYIIRDHNLTDHSDHLLAAPRGMHEELRSGTWATVRYARRRKLPHTIIWPDGRIETIA